MVTGTVAGGVAGPTVIEVSDASSETFPEHTLHTDLLHVGLLHADDPLWLRLWAARYHQHHPELLPPFSVDELAEHGLATNPWPHHHAPGPSTTLPRGAHLPDGDWVKSATSGAKGSVLYLDARRALRVAATRAGRQRLERERNFLEQVIARHLPQVIGGGPRWLMTERLDGTAPSEPGPWMRDLRTFLRDLHTLDAHLPVRGRRPRLSALARINGRAVAGALNDLRRDARDRRPELVPTHGELCAANLLVRDNARLVGVLDFEDLMLAPAERDTASMLVLLSVLTGSRALGLVLAEIPDPIVLAGELVDRLETSARAALRDDPGRPARVATIRYLTRTLLADPGAPAGILPRY